MSEEKFRPFSSGTEYSIWLEKNCYNCKKNVVTDGVSYESHCDIEYALALAYITDGLIPLSIYKRFDDPCPEIERIENA